jgi:hypothetical protein
MRDEVIEQTCHVATVVDGIRDLAVPQFLLHEFTGLISHYKDGSA